MKDDWYEIGGILFGGLTFLASWIYCIATYGYLLGVGLGWLPSLIVGAIVGFLWPLLLSLALLALAFYITTLPK